VGEADLAGRAYGEEILKVSLTIMEVQKKKQKLIQPGAL